MSWRTNSPRLWGDGTRDKKASPLHGGEHPPLLERLAECGVRGLGERAEAGAGHVPHAARAREVERRTRDASLVKQQVGRLGWSGTANERNQLARFTAHERELPDGEERTQLLPPLE